MQPTAKLSAQLLSWLYVFAKIKLFWVARKSQKRKSRKFWGASQIAKKESKKLFTTRRFTKMTLNGRRTNLSQRNDGRCIQNPINNNKIEAFVDNRRLLPEYYEETKKQRIGLERKRDADIPQTFQIIKEK